MINNGSLRFSVNYLWKHPFKWHFSNHSFFSHRSCQQNVFKIVGRYREKQSAIIHIWSSIWLQQLLVLSIELKNCWVKNWGDSYEWRQDSPLLPCSVYISTNSMVEPFQTSWHHQGPTFLEAAWLPKAIPSFVLIHIWLLSKHWMNLGSILCHLGNTSLYIVREMPLPQLYPSVLITMYTLLGFALTLISRQILLGKLLKFILILFQKPQIHSPNLDKKW